MESTDTEKRMTKEEFQNVKDETIHIECDCGAHLLQIQSSIEPKGDEQYFQEFNLAMFYYSDFGRKDTFWRRIKFCWRYLRGGKMYNDQLSLTQEEAKRLADFINKNNLIG